MPKTLLKSLTQWVRAWALEICMAVIISALLFLASWLGFATWHIAGVALLVYALLILVHRLVILDRERQMARAAKDLADSQKNLLLMSDVKNRFIATISHELRTPLTAIQECVQLLNDGVAGPVPITHARFLEMARRNIQKLTSLLDNLLDLSRLETEGMHPTIAKASMEDLVEEAVNSVQPKAQRKKIEILADVQPGLPPVLVDRLRVIQVLNELLDNAIKFTPQGGHVGIDARVPEGSDHMEICVWDSGKGIAPEAMNRMLASPHALDAKEDFTAAGMGLGLAICKEIITQLGGSIWAEKRLSGGSKILFTLMCGSDDALLKTYFRQSVRDALLKNTSFLHLGVALRDLDVLRKHFGSVLISEMLEDVGSMVASCVRMEDRIVVDHAEGLIHVMMLFGKGSLAERIKKLDGCLRNKVFFAGFSELAVQFAYGTAVFPQDGKDLAALKRRVMQQIASGGVDIRTLPWSNAA